MANLPATHCVHFQHFLSTLLHIVVEKAYLNMDNLSKIRMNQVILVLHSQITEKTTANKTKHMLLHLYNKILYKGSNL